MVSVSKFCRIIILCSFCPFINSVEIDHNGYIFYCLCMGRFGNQAEHFLGGMAVAKALNRTLVVPPWRTNKNVEFDEWFQVAPLLEYHRAVLAKDFMLDIAPVIWPHEKRKGFCVQFQQSGTLCDVKQGNPFKNFWDELGVDFVATERYSFSPRNVEQWHRHYPDEPVLALRGAPAEFPINEAHFELHKYLQFSDQIVNSVDSLLVKHFGNTDKDYLGIHLRTGSDWQKACEISTSAPRFMASYQCVGFDGSKKLTKEMCLPFKDTVLDKVSVVLKKTGLKKLLIATDKLTFEADFRRRLGPSVSVVHIDPHLPIIDVALLAQSGYFIGNCVSSFSAFVTRHRIVHGPGQVDYFGA